MSQKFRHSDGTWSDYPESQMLTQGDATANITDLIAFDMSHALKTEKPKGMRFNKGKLRWRNFPMYLVEPLIKVGSANEKHEGNPNGKYPTLNFLNGMKVSDTLDCLHRHLCELSNPDKPDIDPEDNVHHLAKVAWNALVALYYIENKPEWDDRDMKYEENK